jgi:hypothetical protein
MIKEVSVYHFVDGHYDDHDQQPNPPVGNKMLPHTGSIGFANRFVKLSKEEDSRLGQCAALSPDAVSLRGWRCRG